MRLGHSIHRAPEQIRRGMFISIKFAIRLRAPQPEVRAQVDHPQTRLEQRARELRRQPVRQREEGDARAGRDHLAGGGMGKFQMRKTPAGEPRMRG